MLYLQIFYKRAGGTLENHPGRLNPSSIPGSRGTGAASRVVGNTNLSRESGEPYPASHFANAHSSAGQGTSPVSQNNFCGCSPPLWLLFVGFPCSPPVAGGGFNFTVYCSIAGRWGWIKKHPRYKLNATQIRKIYDFPFWRGFFLEKRIFFTSKPIIYM